MFSFKFEKNYSYSMMMNENLIHSHKIRAIINVDRAPTASHSFTRFLKTISLFENSKLNNKKVGDLEKTSSQKSKLNEDVQNMKVNETNPFAIFIPRVGLKIEGKSSAYDLWYFIDTKAIYAVDKDYNVKQNKTCDNMIAKCS